MYAGDEIYGDDVTSGPLDDDDDDEVGSWDCPRCEAGPHPGRACRAEDIAP